MSAISSPGDGAVGQRPFDPRSLRAAAARPPHLRHRPLQLSLQLLHAARGLRPGLPVPPARRTAHLRGDHAAVAHLRRARRREDASHRRGTDSSAGPPIRSSQASTRFPASRTSRSRPTALSSARRRSAGGRRAAAHHRHPRFARRRGLPVDERRGRSRCVVLDGIDAAVAAGLTPIKVNAVVKRGVNDHTVVDLARHFHGTGTSSASSSSWMSARPTAGGSTTWSPAANWSSASRGASDVPDGANYRGRSGAALALPRTGSGEVGIITSISQPFCGDCTRARLPPKDELFTCLFGDTGRWDLRAPLRDGAAATPTWNAVIQASGRSVTTATRNCGRRRRGELPRLEMSRLGG